MRGPGGQGGMVLHVLPPRGCALAHAAAEHTHSAIAPLFSLSFFFPWLLCTVTPADCLPYSTYQPENQAWDRYLPSQPRSLVARRTYKPALHSGVGVIVHPL